MESVTENMPDFQELIPELNTLLAGITNILLGEEKTLEYSTGLHLCVDNCAANKEAELTSALSIRQMHNSKPWIKLHLFWF